MRVVLVVATAVVAVVALSIPRPGGAVVRCGAVSVREFGVPKPVVYRIRIVTGRVSCRTARRVLTTFLQKDVSPRGWFCARGHASQSQRWAAACGTRAGATVRAYRS
jgi:hypothetical protein